jgi:periplasmic divalent cation tolerance protein
MSISLIYFTAPSKEEALRMARSAVQERLAACANVFHPATSIYEWEGKLEETQERCAC